MISSLTALLMVVLTGLAAPDLCIAQSVSASDREALVRLRVDRGGRAEEVDALIRQADEAAAKGVPAAPLTNKIREGLAKGHDPKRIELVIGQMATQLETADRLLREIEPAAAGREVSVTLLAESLGSGISPDEVRELRRRAQPASKTGQPPMSAEWLAGAAKGLSFIKEARLSMSEGTSVIAEALRQGFRSHEILDLGREIKRREGDFLAGRASLRALRDAIARGDRPEQLFRPARTEAGARPASARPETPVRPARPETPQRPEPPARTERPERPAPGAIARPGAARRSEPDGCRHVRRRGWARAADDDCRKSAARASSRACGSDRSHPCGVRPASRGRSPRSLLRFRALASTATSLNNLIVADNTH